MISILIPSYNAKYYLELCLQSILWNTNQIHYEIIILDNGSTDGTQDFLNDYVVKYGENGNVTCLCYPYNVGYLQAINRMANIAKGEILVLLNDDVIVTGHWLERMLKVYDLFKDKYKIGSLGFTSQLELDLPDWKIPEQDKYIKDFKLTKPLNEFIWHLNKFNKTLPPYAAKFWRNTGFAVMIKRDVFFEVGGLDTRYGGGLYEDDDFSLKLIMNGYENFRVPIFIYHWVSRSFDQNLEAKQLAIAKNRKIFIGKWGFDNIDVANNLEKIKENYMAHKEMQDFCLSVAYRFPKHFVDKKVLDVGSLDVNGNNQYLFINCNVTGNDVKEGLNVDVVSLTHNLTMPDKTFDTIISTECFEHDCYLNKSIKNIIRMLKKGGLFLFTCATANRKEHGTRRSSMEDCPLLLEVDPWIHANHYKNLFEKDFREIEGFNEAFQECQFITNRNDLYFWGIKGE